MLAMLARLISLAGLVSLLIKNPLFQAVHNNLWYAVYLLENSENVI